jgi:hypothetical protein
MPKEWPIISIILILLGCSSNTLITDETRLNALIDNEDSTALIEFSDQLIQRNQWHLAFTGYHWLCRHQKIKVIDNSCDIMWATAYKSEVPELIFDAAAVMYHISAQTYWIDIAKNNQKTQSQSLIIKTLQQQPLDKSQRDTLLPFSLYYAQALFIKGKVDHDLNLLGQAVEKFITLKQWQQAADVHIIMSKFSLNKNLLSNAKSHFHSAYVYYQIAGAKEKQKMIKIWGIENGLTR